jgi:hypothetical protein
LQPQPSDLAFLQSLLKEDWDKLVKKVDTLWDYQLAQLCDQAFFTQKAITENRKTMIRFQRELIAFRNLRAQGTYLDGNSKVTGIRIPELRLNDSHRTSS